MVITSNPADLEYFSTTVVLLEGHKSGQDSRQNKFLDSVCHLVVNFYIDIDYFSSPYRIFTFKSNGFLSNVPTHHRKYFRTLGH